MHTSSSIILAEIILFSNCQNNKQFLRLAKMAWGQLQKGAAAKKSPQWVVLRQNVHLGGIINLAKRLWLVLFPSLSQKWLLHHKRDNCS